ncbi:MAG TPA: hypothetical protein VFL71_07945 [Actinomycetes bacterium]|nr:hypothetical protein [Actinomycetes bacterium]
MSGRELSGRARRWGRTAAGEHQRLVPRYLADARAVRPRGARAPPSSSSLRQPPSRPAGGSTDARG